MMKYTREELALPNNEKNQVSLSPDQHVEAVLQATVLGGAPGLAGCRVRGQM